MLPGKNGHRVQIRERHPQVCPLPHAVTFDDETARTLAGIGFDPDTGPKMEFFDADYFRKNGDREILQTLNCRGEQPTGWWRWYWFNLPSCRFAFRRCSK
jgi:hypothetical protein